MSFFYKLFLGKPEFNKSIRHSTYENQWKNLKRIWNNEKQDDIGLEKILRIILVLAQFLFLGIHVRNFFGKKGLAYKVVGIELYVLLKTILPVIIIIFKLYEYKVFAFLALYMGIETILYIATLIFVSDMFTKPYSYRRSMLMLFLNYIELAMEFAILYASFHLLKGATSSIHYMYFSFTSAATLGASDISANTDLGMVLVCVQSVLVLVFVALFMNFFGSRVNDDKHETNH